jgi:hypothetical protein
LNQVNSTIQKTWLEFSFKINDFLWSTNVKEEKNGRGHERVVSFKVSFLPKKKRAMSCPAPTIHAGISYNTKLTVRKTWQGH